MKKIIASIVAAATLTLGFASGADAGTYSKNDKISATIINPLCEDGKVVWRVQVKNNTKKEKTFEVNFERNGGSNFQSKMVDIPVAPGKTKNVRFKVDNGGTVKISALFKGEVLDYAMLVNPTPCFA